MMGLLDLHPAVTPLGFSHFHPARYVPSLLSPAALPTLAASAISSMSTGDVWTVAQWPGLEGPAAVAWDAENPAMGRLGKTQQVMVKFFLFFKKTCTLWKKYVGIVGLKRIFLKEHAI